jgi:transglutaminase-like putative cysteine protease
MAQAKGKKTEKRPGAVPFFAALALLCLAGLVFMYLDTYELRPRRTVGNAKDPRFRVVDFNSRQATEGEIYDAAEVPVIAKVREAGPRRLRLEFKPAIRADAWEVRDALDGRLVFEGRYPEIPFPGEPGDLAVVLVPRGVRLLKEIRLVINFYPKEAYAAKGLSWPDNYWLKSSSVPIGTKTPHGVDEWAGLPDDDTELEQARRLLPADFVIEGPALDRAERVFRFVAEKLKDAGGAPSDAVQAASPLETFRLLESGRGRGFCENRALVYYLFANAAGVKTRLVDMAGKLGPLKLTGHYFCESWIPEEGRWIFVDPQSSIASVRDPEGRLLHALGVKKAFDAGAFGGCTLRMFDPAAGAVVTASAGVAAEALRDYFSGRPVLAFKFGYGRNKGFSRLRSFALRPTLLYADFRLPRLYLFKSLAAAGFVVSIVFTLVFLALRRRGEKKRKMTGFAIGRG